MKNMYLSISKTIIYIFLLSITKSFGQSPQTILLNSSKKDQSSFFYSIQGIYDLKGLDHFTDNLNYSSKVIFNKRSKKRFQIPATLFIGQLKSSNENILNSKSQIVNENFGLGIGVHPEFNFIPYDNKFYLNANVALSWRFNGFQTAQDEIKYINSGRASINIEVGYNLFNDFSNNRPLSLTITPIRSIFQPDDYMDLYDMNKSGFNALEISTNIPLGKGSFSFTGKSIFLDAKLSYLGIGIALSGKL